MTQPALDEGQAWSRLRAEVQKVRLGAETLDDTPSLGYSPSPPGSAEAWDHMDKLSWQLLHISEAESHLGPPNIEEEMEDTGMSPP